MRSHAPKARTRQALWNVKQERPELFGTVEVQEQLLAADADRPPGFEASSIEGFWYHQVQNVYMHKQSGRLCWLEPSSNELRNLHQGGTLALTCSSGAASRLCGPGGAASASSSSTACPGASGAAASVPKHVIIPDLHRAAQALKAELGHLDRPAAMVALFGASATATAGGQTADLAARAFHEKLIKRLAGFRGAWSKQALRTAIAQTLEDIAKAEGDSQFTAAVALVVGSQVATVSIAGARFCIAGGIRAERDQACDFTGQAASVHLEASDPESSAAERSDELSVVLLLGQADAGRVLGDDAVLAAAAPRLRLGRPRAASVAILQAAQARGTAGQLAIACVRLFGTGPDSAEQAAKRRKIAAASKVRVRQILLRHWKAAQQPTDPIRRKVVTRTPDEAEVQSLEVLDGLIADPSSFSAVCKAMSECQSALKGGELIGDLGWLDRSMDSAQEGKPRNPTAAIRSVVPASVRRAAFDLEVGELSDLISSDIGIHLLLRTA